MLTNYLLPLISAIFFLEKTPSLPNESIITHFKRNLRGEANGMIWKFLIGVILTSIIIFSGIRLALLGIDWLAQFQNDRLFELITFGSLLIMNSIILYFMLSDHKRKIIEKRNEKIQEERNRQLQNLAINFVTGFLQGANKSNQ